MTPSTLKEWYNLDLNETKVVLNELVKQVKDSKELVILLRKLNYPTPESGCVLNHVSGSIVTAWHHSGRLIP